MKAARKLAKRRLKAGNIVEVDDKGEVIKNNKKKNADADGDADMDDDDGAASTRTKDTENDKVVIVGQNGAGLQPADTKRIPVLKSHSGNKKVAKVRGDVSKKMRSGGVKKK